MKCRIGVDDVDSYDDGVDSSRLSRPRSPAPSAGGRPLFAVHARKALLDGLSPAENRTVPPATRVGARVGAGLPDVGFALNGGVTRSPKPPRLRGGRAGV